GEWPRKECPGSLSNGPGTERRCPLGRPQSDQRLQTIRPTSSPDPEQQCIQRPIGNRHRSGADQPGTASRISPHLQTARKKPAETILGENQPDPNAVHRTTGKENRAS